MLHYPRILSNVVLMLIDTNTDTDINIVHKQLTGIWVVVRKPSRSSSVVLFYRNNNVYIICIIVVFLYELMSTYVNLVPSAFKCAVSGVLTW